MEKKSEKIGNVRLDLTHYGGRDLYSEGSAEDRILEIVKKEPAEKCNAIIASEHTWNALYHLSDIRGNIADFIPISEKHKVLEIGAGCGAVTGTLARKAEKVTVSELSYKRSLINAYRNREASNIEILVGNFEDIEPELTEEYDYIFLIGVLEYAGSYITRSEGNPYLAMLQMLIPHLAQGGEIVIAIENKYGMKYLAGCREDHTGKFYDGIEGYQGNKGVRTFSKNGLMTLAKQSGLRAEFYYPYPDYKLPAVIFSDKRLPRTGELGGRRRNFDADRFVAFDEAKAFDEAVREGKFPEVSNSFLVFMSVEDRIESFDVRHVLYSRHSDERDTRYQIRTDILSDGFHNKYVVKYPKTQAAEAHLLGMYDNSSKLRASLKGSTVRVNKAKLLTNKDGDFLGVQFEYLPGKTLDSIVSDLIIKDKRDAAFNIVKQFAVFVRAKKLPDLDFLFSNIMITSDGAWNITDYEWIKEGAEPEFIIYRALRYFLSEHAGLVTKDELYRAAGFDGSREDEFDRMETEFQQKISGDYFTLDKMYSIFGRDYVTLPQAKEVLKGLDRPFHVRLYADMGEGYAEGSMPNLDGELTPDMKLSLDIPLPEGIKKLRVDPQEGYCIIKLLCASVQEALVNGRVCGSTVVFDNKDPQIIFDIPQDLDVFHIEYRIMMTDSEMYEDILSRLIELETRPKGLLRKPVEKEEYVKISAVHRAD